jgi:predicted ABC-class ATPase
MERDPNTLDRVLRGIDGRGYKAYRDVKGAWDFPDFCLFIDHVQSDPFAAPSRIHVDVSSGVAGFAPDLLSSPSRRIGLACHLARAFSHRAGDVTDCGGTGRSGEIRIETPGQEVLAQTAVIVSEEGSVQARFTVGLPARGRRVMGPGAAQLLTETVPAIVRDALFADSHDLETLRQHAITNEDATALRDQLPGMGLVAFIADGATLPRRSGVDDTPLADDTVIPFKAPESLRVTLDRPNRGPVTGMGIPVGITLIVGGGYHGKSTLLRGLEHGVYNHRPGDGRECVVTDPSAVKVRAEDGRSVAGVDISPFINGLPGGQDTNAFVSPNASGSTSQAAAIVEAVEAGAGALLVDEDTAATNFMIRDRRMQALIPRSAEPITPFVDRIRQLYQEWGVSSILVLGGSGDYLETADTVVAMTAYRASDVTDRAREVARELSTGRSAERVDALPVLRPRIPVPESIQIRRGRRESYVKVRDRHTLTLGPLDLDLSAVGPILSRAQANTLGHALVLIRTMHLDGTKTLPQILDALDALIATRGLDSLDTRHPGDLVAIRRYEVAAALNRLRSLRVHHAAPNTASS